MRLLRARAVAALGSGQLQKRDFRPGAEPDGEAGGPDAAVHVQLRAVLCVPPSVIAINESAEVESLGEEIERQLAAMSVPRQRQIDA
jgi:hypothetical protein